MYHGDIRLGDTIDIKFCTVATTGAPTTLAGTPSVAAYPGNSTTEITAGITLTVDFDARTGMHNVRVVATSGNGYATATNYVLVITAGTVGGTSVVGYCVGSFSIENRSAVMPTTAGRTLDVSAGGEAGVDWANVGSPTTSNTLSGTTIGTATALGSGAVTAAAIAADAITAAKIADGAIDRATFAADTGLVSFRSNTAQAGAAGSITLDASASSTTDFYVGAWIVLTGATGAGQARVCTAYNGTSKVATIAPNWATNPDNTTTFAVMPAAHVAGVQGSVTGSVASVTGNVGGNVTGSVGSVTAAVTVGTNNDKTGYSIASSGITSSSFAAGAIDAAAIAADAIGSSELAASAASEIAAAVWDEARSGHTTSGSFGQGVASVQGNVTGSVASVSGSVGSVASGGISAASIAADAITAAKIADGAIDRATFAADTGLQPISSGTAEGGTSTTITLGPNASTITNLYVGLWILLTGGTGAGQVRRMANYNGSTKVATIGQNTTEALWVVNPDSTTTYAILPAAWVPGAEYGASVANCDNVASVGLSAITSTSFASNAIGAAAIATDAIGSAELAASAATEIAAAVWDKARSSHTTSGTFGEGVASVQGNVTGSVASVAANGISASSIANDAITAAKIATDAIDADALAADAVTEIWAKAVTEPTTVPASTATALSILAWLLALSRNKITQTSTTQILKADDGSTTIATSTHSDDGATHTRGEFA
jgi:hypothetical protein